MSDGLLVRVTTAIDGQGEPVITLWVVATTNRRAAIAIVREAKSSRAEHGDFRAAGAARDGQAAGAATGRGVEAVRCWCSYGGGAEFSRLNGTRMFARKFGRDCELAAAIGVARYGLSARCDSLAVLPEPAAVLPRARSPAHDSLRRLAAGVEIR